MGWRERGAPPANGERASYHTHNARAMDAKGAEPAAARPYGATGPAHLVMARLVEYLRDPASRRSIKQSAQSDAGRRSAKKGQSRLGALYCALPAGKVLGKTLGEPRRAASSGVELPGRRASSVEQRHAALNQ